jgi:hypothetical protein
MVEAKRTLIYKKRVKTKIPTIQEILHLNFLFPYFDHFLLFFPQNLIKSP